MILDGKLISMDKHLNVPADTVPSIVSSVYCVYVRALISIHVLANVS